MSAGFSMRLIEIARILDASQHGGSAEDRLLTGVSTDSRSVKVGELFVALSGENFDGHAFVTRAAERGAVAALVSRVVPEAKIPQILVGDTRLALGRLAQAWRQRFQIPVLALTGSNGKTTVKEMLRAILVAHFGDANALLATEGNLNNDIGVPQMLFRLSAEHAYAVIEMGASHPGDIEYLSRLAQPTVAVITNAGPAHLEGLNNVAEVAHTKGGIYRGLPVAGSAVINADDMYNPLWREMASGHAQISFGMQAPATVHTRVHQVTLRADGSGFMLHTPRGSIHIELSVLGLHNVYNALAASAAALAVNIELAEIRAGLATLTPVTGRLQPKRGVYGAHLIDDTYNANPASVRAAIAVLAALPGERLVVLGDMGELGPAGPSLHAEIGAVARAAGITRLYALGELSVETVRAFGKGATHYTAHKHLIDAVRTGLQAGAGAHTVLIKGSRFMRMEQIVAALLEP